MSTKKISTSPSAGTDTVIKEHESAFKWLENIIEMINKYGVFKMIGSVLFMLFFSYAVYLSFNPQIIFDKYSEYIEKQHGESVGYRMETSPLIQGHLDNLVKETGAMRAYVIEMHNGKNNPTGLSFVYGSLKYESVCDTSYSVMEDYADFSLERFPVFSLVYKDNYWCGTIDELKCIDRRFALRAESNDASYIVLSTMYGVKEDIGFLGLSFGPNHMTEEEIHKIINKYSVKMSPLLDGYESRRR